MQDNQAKFRSADGKRLVLVVEDEELIDASALERVRLDERMNLLLGIQTALTVLLLAVVLAIVIFISG